MMLSSGHPLFVALGWALLHFLWQGAALALLLLCFQALARKAPPSTRYAANCIAMLAMIAVFAGTVFRHYPMAAAVDPNRLITQPPASPVHDAATATNPLLAAASSPAGVPPDWIACLWLLGVAVMSIYTAQGWTRVQRLKRDALQPVQAACLDGLKRRLGITRVVHVCTSAMAEVPAVIGCLKPHILLPVIALTGLTELQLRAILAHELAHIRRHDYLVNLLQAAVETLLFFHPAVWWVSREIRREREHCCDDIAVAVCGDPLEYAAALAGMEEIRARIPDPALAANGGELVSRIRRLLGEPTPSSRPAGAFAVIALTLLITATALVSLHAAPQDSKAAQFEVASVKQLDQALRPGEQDLSFVGTAGKPFKISGNRITVGGTLHALIADAYAVKDYQISALPAWADSLKFNILAESPGADAPTQDQVRPMLQVLLADRFQLKFHRESKEMAVYHLTQVKPSKKFTPAGPEETFSWNLTQVPEGLRSKATKESIGDFVQLVAVSTDRPVIDKTGITGFIDYDITIEQPSGLKTAVPEGRTEGQNRPGITAEEQNRAIISAVQDQLGLKLEPSKDQVDLLVIDRAEKPSAD